MLENVLFTVLQVPKSEIDYLEDKRITSSFYYNLWYNAKSFLASKIYGDKNNGINKERKNDSLNEVNQNDKNIDNNIENNEKGK